MDYEWLINRLIDTEYVENGPELDKAECQKLLDKISEISGKCYTLIVNINIELREISYDYILDNNTKNEVLMQEWDNRYL